MQLGRHVILARHDQHGVVGVALLPGPVELLEAAGLADPAVLGLEDDPPPRRPRAGIDRCDHVALLAAGAGLVTDRLGHVALGGGDVIERVAYGLLVGAPLGRAAIPLLRDLLQPLLLLTQPLKLLLQLAHLREQRALHLVLTLVGLLEQLEGADLEVRERILAGVGR